MRLIARLLIISLVAVLLAALFAYWPPAPPQPWQPEELALIRSLSLKALTPIPAGSNRVARDARAADLGRRLFFDPRLSANGEVSCSLCHQPNLDFTDGRPLGQAIGTSARNTRSLSAAGYSPWLYWDGRRDSLWAQALSPLEDPAEHGGNRMSYAHFIASEPSYRQAYESLFGPLPELSDESRFPRDAAPGANPDWNRAWVGMTGADRRAINTVFANLGKAIAAFERLIVPQPSPFDAYVAALQLPTATPVPGFGAAQQRGLRVFIGRGRCIECHNGPLLSNNEFHNTGVLPAPGQLPDRGRSNGLRQLRADPFNCQGAFNDAPQAGCPELEFARDDTTLLGAFRTPGLRNVALTAPYMHRGQIESLAEVIRHYNEAPDAVIGHNEAEPLGLTGRERKDLEAFLHALSGPRAPLAPSAP